MSSVTAIFTKRWPVRHRDHPSRGRGLPRVTGRPLGGLCPEAPPGDVVGSGDPRRQRIAATCRTTGSIAGMTVMVTGAPGRSHALVPLFVAATRCAPRAAPRGGGPACAPSAPRSRSAGLDDAERWPRCSGVFTLVHLVGGPDQAGEDALWEANHRSVFARWRPERPGFAVRLRVGARRPRGADPFLRAKGTAEEGGDDVGAPARGHPQHARVRPRLSGSPRSPGRPRSAAGRVGRGQRPTPRSPADLAAVLAAMDDLAGSPGTWALEGPDVTTADGGSPARRRRRRPEHLTARRPARLSAVLERDPCPPSWSRR